MGGPLKLKNNPEHKPNTNQTSAKEFGLITMDSRAFAVERESLRKDPEEEH